MQISNWPAFIASRAAALKAVMIDEGTKRKPLYPALLSVEPLDGNRVEMRTVTGIGMMQPVVGEKASNITAQEMVNRFSKVFTYVWYATKMEFTKPFLMDDMDRFGSQYARQIPKAGHNTEEYISALLFYGMTDATNYPTPDGKAWAADDHPLYANDIGGAVTYDNYVNATFGEDSLVTAMVMADSFVDDRGYPEVLTPSILLCVPALWPEVVRVLDSQLRNNTADNDLNLFQGTYNLTPVRWHFLGALSTTYWAVICKEHGGKFMRRQGLQTDTNTNFEDYSFTAKGDLMFSVGVLHFKGFVGGSL